MDGSGSSSLVVPRLPDDALVQILSHLRAKSLCRCKCVSRPWRDLIADRLSCKDLPKTLQGFLYLDAVSGGDGDSDGDVVVSSDGDADADGSGGGGDGDGDGSRDGDAEAHGSNDGDVDAEGGGGEGYGDGSSDGEADADGGDVASGRNEMLLRHGYGRFINLLGEPVSLLDPTFAFMKERSGIQAIELVDSCNGLLLFGHRRVSDTYDSLGYIVCNPITEQCVTVPSSGWVPVPPEEIINEDSSEKDVCTFLLFDPSVSSHFDLVQFWQHGDDGWLDEVDCVHTYSSVTGLWSDRSSEWRGHGGGWGKWGDCALLESPKYGRALVNGMLHILIHRLGRDSGRDELVAVDNQGRTRRVIECPNPHVVLSVGFIGQSQGRIHYIGSTIFDEGGVSKSYGHGLSIWVLEDYNTEEWVLKHSLNLRHLFEGVYPQHLGNYDFVGFHTDRNMMFFVHYEDRKFISYDMDSREVHVLCSLTPGHGNPYVTPYVPSLQSL